MWGLTFNSGATCIAPRRVVAGGDQVAELGTRLAERFADAGPRRVSQRSADDCRRLVGQAIESGSAVISPRGFGPSELAAACDRCELPPIVLRAGSPPPALLRSDVFAMVVTLIAAESLDERVAAANDSPFALGASVFGPPAEAARVAKRLRAGCVTVNDLIAPTGDPRVPFGGTTQSGYGVTRGAEGLLAMTRPQAVVRRHGAWLPHLDEPTPALDDLLAGLIQSRHAPRLGARLAGVRRLVRAALRGRKKSHHGATEGAGVLGD